MSEINYIGAQLPEGTRTFGDCKVCGALLIEDNCMSCGTERERGMGMAKTDGMGNRFVLCVHDIQESECLKCRDTRIAALEAEVQRLTDLVRYARHLLFDANLISPDEFARLVEDSESGQRVARLEGYDALRAKVAALEAENGRLREALTALSSDCLRWMGTASFPVLCRPRSASHKLALEALQPIPAQDKEQG